MATATKNNRADILGDITASLKSFKGGVALQDSAIALFKTLGYHSLKMQRLSSPNFEGFKDAFSIDASAINKDKALVKDWARIDFLFQFGDKELSGLTSKRSPEEVDEKEYQSFLFIAIELKSSEYKRADLVGITREINRPFFMPVIVLFHYDNKLTLSIIDRRLHKLRPDRDVLQKVTLIRDIDLIHTHRAHIEILADLSLLNLSSAHSISSFVTLHEAWKKTLSTSELNKRFYRELSNWYFWATKQVIFPGAPTAADAHRKNVNLNELLQEHRATNVIRMLTRLLFVWFIKEKGLIPEELFELNTLQKDILKDISPHHETGMFLESNRDSVYYKAVLQNLFFATLNCPIEAESIDKRKRGFRGDGYGTHRGIDYLMRYKQYFKKPDKFLDMMNSVVPFLNGGLFECLDDKYQNKYIDGFSDQMTQGEQLVVPDYIFFGVEEKVDLSNEYGVSNAATKKAAVKGLINILKSYKFTITENTPIEEDVALDPELLGKVFENLLASYNPETKTTARKQTGSFYTPREIVDYMVNESLMAFLKTAVSDWGKSSEDEIDKELRALTSFDHNTPFGNNKLVQTKIIQALSGCKILDPACGSGAFPMGVLQKMVHMLQKLDPENRIWRDVQLEKAKSDSDAAFDIDDKQDRGERLQEINDAFDQSINDPDYARKLFLIETCIYGVDIQPIATQISKLRFFISLVVEQKVNPDKANFGIRPLPNLETKFVAANTLVDIEKPTAQTTLYNTPRIKELESELKAIRSRLFNARTKDTKLKYRNKDLELRTAIATELKKTGWANDAADKLAGWDPYDQNNASLFFNPEWMFDVSDGFDVVVGNPPYISYYGKNAAPLSNEHRNCFVNQYQAVLKANDRINAMNLMVEKGISLLTSNGHLSFITNKTIAVLPTYAIVRKFILGSSSITYLASNLNPFEAVVDCVIIGLGKKSLGKDYKVKWVNTDLKSFELKDATKILANIHTEFHFPQAEELLFKIEENTIRLDTFLEVNRGVNIGGCFDDFLSPTRSSVYYQKYISGTRNVVKYHYEWTEEDGYMFFDEALEKSLKAQGKTIALGNHERYKVERLIIPESGQTLLAAYSNEPLYTAYGLMTGTLASDIVNLKFLCSVLNSKLLTHYAIEREILRKGNKATPHVGVKGLNGLPIKLPKSQLPFITLVDRILLKKKEGKDTAKEEDEIDRLIYELYELTEEEITLIERNC